jgi:hypothetical protein
MFDLIWYGALIGVGASLLMDAWAVVLWLFLGQNAPNWAGPGRWVWNLQYGKVFHDDIGAAEPFAYEQALGWTFHYFTGAVYGILLLAFTGTAWLADPTFIPAWILGIVTVGAGWFLLQPGLGIGWAASKLPNPGKARIMNLVAHTVFAIGLWGTALLVG